MVALEHESVVQIGDVFGRVSVEMNEGVDGTRSTIRDTSEGEMDEYFGAQSHSDDVVARYDDNGSLI